MERRLDVQVDNTAIEKQNWIIHKAGEHYDYVFLGSSRVYNQLDASLLESKINKSCLNLGLSGVGIAEQILIVELYLENNTAGHILIQLDDYSFNSVTNLSYPFHDYAYLPHSNNVIVDKHFQSNLPFLKYWTWKIIPNTKYFEFNSRIPASRLWSNSNEKREFDDHGSNILVKHDVSDDKQKEIWKDHSIKGHFIPEPKTLENLDKLLNLIKERNIPITIYTAPELMVNENFLELRYGIDKRIDSLAVARNIQRLRLDHDSIFSNESFFLDKTHLNRSGVDYFTTILGKEITEKLITN